MLVKIRSQFRFTIPVRLRKKLGLGVGDVIEIILEKNSHIQRIISKIQKGNQIKIWSSAKKRFNLNNKEAIKIVKIKRLTEIFNFPNSFVSEDKIDLLSLIPNKSSRNNKFRVFKLENDKILLWIENGRCGIPKPVIINRFVSFRFCRFLGLLEAEGEQFRKVQRRCGLPLCFTNKTITLHKVIIDSLHELGIKDEEMKLICSIPKDTHSELESKIINNFLDILQINPKKIKFRRLEKIGKRPFKNFVFQIVVNRTILAELLLFAILKLRKFLADNKLNEITHKVACEFISGVLMGDGTFGITIDKIKNSISASLAIREPNIKNLKECERILQKLEFNTTLKLFNKPLPTLFIFSNWKDLVWKIFKNEMLKEQPFSWIKLLISIKRMRQWRTSIRFKFFDKPVSSREFGVLLGMKSDDISLWLQRREKEGLVKRVRIIDNFKVIWDLTDKGKEFRELLIDIDHLNTEMSRLFGTSNFDDIRKIIKGLNGNEINNQTLMFRIFNWLVHYHHTISVSLNTSNNSGFLSKCSLSGLSISDNSLATLNLRSRG